MRAWRSQPRIAHLTPLRRPGGLRRRDVDEVVDSLVGAGVTGVVTGAVGPHEEQVFLDAGFAVHERLLLLRHDLAELSDPSLDQHSVTMRRAGRRDRTTVLDVDTLAFGDFWQLDDACLSDAIRATPHARFRVAEDRSDSGTPVIGYAITGRAGTSGFLQRLAVRPDQQGRSIGRALVLDALQWLKRRRAHHALVNTQHVNERAAELYERVGFVREPYDLAVLRWGEAP